MPAVNKEVMEISALVEGLNVNLSNQKEGEMKRRLVLLIIFVLCSVFVFSNALAANPTKSRSASCFLSPARLRRWLKPRGMGRYWRWM